MRVALIGAYGYTGSLICNELALGDISFIAVGKNQGALHELQLKYLCISKTILADIATEEGIESVLSNSDLIINCAGPFTEESSGLCDAVARTGKIYLDVCGELEFVKNSYNFNHAIAQSSGATLIHGCAFESLPADLVLNLFSTSLSIIKDLRSFYNFAHSRPSPGTRLTMKLARFRNALMISDGKWQKSDYTKDSLNISWSNNPELAIGIPYPLPDAVFVWSKCKPEFAASYLLLSKDAAVFLDSSRSNGISKNEIIAKHKKMRLPGPDHSERASQLFKLIIYGQDKNEKLKTVLIQGSDMYLCTAKAIALSINNLLSSIEIPKGVCRPAELFKGREVETIGQLGLEIEEVFDFKFT